MPDIFLDSSRKERHFPMSIMSERSDAALSQGEAERATPFRPKVQERSILVQGCDSECGRGSPRRPSTPMPLSGRSDAALSQGEAERATPFRPKVQERSILVQGCEAHAQGGARGVEGRRVLDNERRG